MRLTTVILIATFIQVSATGFAQKISMSKSNASLLSVFKEIRSQSGYNFVCAESILKNASTVTINVKNVELKDVLNEIFNKQSLTYAIDSKVVVVKEKRQPFVDVLFGNSGLRQDSLLFKGRVLDEKGDPLPGATIKLKSGTKASVANATGYFERYGTLKSILVVSFLGYQTQEISLNGQDPDRPIIIRLVPGQNQLGEVNIVSTGYQDIPKERATGSFEVISKEQLQHSTDPSLLRRLEGITTSMDFRNDSRSLNPSSLRSRVSPLSNLTIRGKNTLNPLSVNSATINTNQSGIPLVVIDGIASAYNIESIDPNDVESISILKDAASASIWGSRAANGVIVIKTKRGSLNMPPRVSFNVNFNSTDKIDLFYKKQMSVSDFIDAQVFANPFYWPGPVDNPTDPFNPQPYMSPVAEILNKKNLGLIDDTELNRQLDILRGNDLRRDFTDLFLRNSFVQNYSVSVDGGNKSTTYRLSGSFANTLKTLKGYNSNRYTFNYNTTFNPLKNLKIDAILSYSRGYDHFSDPNASGRIDISNNGNVPYYPYARLADDQGNALVLSRDYRPAFIDLLEQTYGNDILNMRWKPLDDYKKSYEDGINHGINLNTTVGYKIAPFLSANVTYSYNKNIGNTERLQPQETYEMSHLINRFTNREGLARAVPLGARYQTESLVSDGHTLRGLLNLDKTWKEKHNITAIAGVDVSEVSREFRSDQVYGYDPATLKFNNEINFKDYLPTLFNNLFGEETAKVPYPKTFLDYKNRQFSAFSNVAYNYDNRYTLSASIRKDASSAFGPSTNKTGTPYYSFGGAWSINNEKFYQQAWLPILKLRITYGYNGNVNTSVTADPLINYNPRGTNGLPYVSSENIATNSRLRPERSGVLNFGLDFGLKENKLSGSVEYYVRKTYDLLTQNKVDPSIGFSNLTFNTGDLKTTGIDVILNSVNLKAGAFDWTSNLLFSYNRVKVTKLFVPGAKTAGFLAGNAQFTEGYDLSRIFAWKWAGLDPETGDPRVFLDGEAVKVDGADFDLVTRLNDSSIDNLRYFGSAVPMYFGAFRNTFTYGSFSLSANLLYKFGYYSFRKDAVEYWRLFDEFGVNEVQGAEYAQRWKQPGDEKFTNVPSQVFNPGFNIRDNFYKLADINVFKADHIRLQEINLSYTFNKPKWFIQNLRVYANVSNIGIIWRANKLGVDPDTFDYPQPRTYSLGFSANF